MSGCGPAICRTCCWNCPTLCVVFIYQYCIYIECVTNNALAHLLCTEPVSSKDFLHFDPELSQVMQRLVLYSAPRYSSLCRVSLKEDQNHGAGQNDYQQLM